MGTDRMEPVRQLRSGMNRVCAEGWGREQHREQPVRAAHVSVEGAPSMGKLRSGIHGTSYAAPGQGSFRGPHIPTRPFRPISTQTHQPHHHARHPYPHLRIESDPEQALPRILHISVATAASSVVCKPEERHVSTQQCGSLVSRLAPSVCLCQARPRMLATLQATAHGQ